MYVYVCNCEETRHSRHNSRISGDVKKNWNHEVKIHVNSASEPSPLLLIVTSATNLVGGILRTTSFLYPSRRARQNGWNSSPALPPRDWICIIPFTYNIKENRKTYLREVNPSTRLLHTFKCRRVRKMKKEDRVSMVKLCDATVGEYELVSLHRSRLSCMWRKWILGAYAEKDEDKL